VVQPIHRADAVRHASHACGSPLRISANVTGDFGSVTDSEPMLCCTGKIVGMMSCCLTARSMSRDSQLSQITEGPSPESAFMQGKLAQISREMEGLPDEPTIAQLDAAIKTHLKV
jgi:hypothetical protein